MSSHVQNWAKAHIEKRDFLVIDTETSGLGSDAEVLQVTVVNSWGKVCFSSLVKPRVSIDESGTACAVNCITNAMVERAPSMCDIGPALSIWLSSIERPVSILAYNASFDRRLLEQSIRRWIPSDMIGGSYFPEKTWECVLEKYIEYRKSCGNGTLEKNNLRSACAQFGLPLDRNWHAAEADALATFDLLRAMAALGEEQR